ncbi:MAG TPA: hypothetical protein VNW15_10840 [Rhizomicrobium sp.]|jgi:hypothetical protein|nr:hypothetical protein [Rhizomicrobium sp.]
MSQTIILPGITWNLPRPQKGANWNTTPVSMRALRKACGEIGALALEPAGVATTNFDDFLSTRLMASGAVLAGDFKLSEEADSWTRFHANHYELSSRSGVSSFASRSWDSLYGTVQESLNALERAQAELDAHISAAPEFAGSEGDFSYDSVGNELDFDPAPIFCEVIDEALKWWSDTLAARAVTYQFNTGARQLQAWTDRREALHMSQRARSAFRKDIKSLLEAGGELTPGEVRKLFRRHLRVRAYVRAITEAVADGSCAMVPSTAQWVLGFMLHTGISPPTVETRQAVSISIKYGENSYEQSFGPSAVRDCGRRQYRRTSTSSRWADLSPRSFAIGFTQRGRHQRIRSSFPGVARQIHSAGCWQVGNKLRHDRLRPRQSSIGEAS